MWKKLLAPLLAAALLPAQEFPVPGRPFRVEAGGKPVDVEIGHAAPCLFDFDGDGKTDLLVGQFGGGKLRIYRNVGAPGKPAFRDFTWFQAGGKEGRVPSG